MSASSSASSVKVLGVILSFLPIHVSAWQSLLDLPQIWTEFTSSDHLEEPHPGRLSPALCSFPLPALCLAASTILQVSTDVAYLPKALLPRTLRVPDEALLVTRGGPRPPVWSPLWVHPLHLPSHLLQPPCPPWFSEHAPTTRPRRPDSTPPVWILFPREGLPLPDEPESAHPETSPAPSLLDLTSFVIYISVISLHHGREGLLSILFPAVFLESVVCSQMAESTCNAGDPGSIPLLGRSPGEGNGNHSASTLA